MDPRTDAELIAESLQQPSVFGEIFDRHAEALAGYVIRRVGVADGESLLGELFRIAFESRDRFIGSRPDARPWLYGIASNLVLKHLRSTGRRLEATRRLASRPETMTVQFDERIVEDAAVAELWSRVSGAIDDLPD